MSVTLRNSSQKGEQPLQLLLSPDDKKEEGHSVPPSKEAAPRPRSIHTKAVGVNAEPDRQRTLAEAQRLGIRTGQLVPEPDNPYDCYAVRVLLPFADGPRMIGYLPSRLWVCEQGHNQVTTRPPTRCLNPRCSSVRFERRGLAREISENLLRGARYQVRVRITGGDRLETPEEGRESKVYGCNLELIPV